jgi:lipopolysaccharide transport system ATP-binding protein
MSLYSVRANNLLISVENLSKCYPIKHYSGAQQHLTLRDAVSTRLHKLGRWLSSKCLGSLRAQSSEVESSPRTVENFWALKDVTFQIQQGDVVGIVGRNGAGKSTLLKVLSRITEPTQGRVRIKGRVSSLLEVGTGFHPELTGRENILLNGAILGMSRREILGRFDEIVAFAEVEKFLDTPVKRYSSGMYVRLAFAVAAHLEPEILVVDEVLAVGDAEFQKKCLGKMQNVATEGGRTVLFVSHNLGAVSALCNQGILLENGRLKQTGRIEKVLSSYLETLQLTTTSLLRDRLDRSGTGTARLERICFLDRADKPLAHLLSGMACDLAFEFQAKRPLTSARLKFTIYSRHGQPLTHFDSQFASQPLPNFQEHGRIRCRFTRLPLAAGSYSLNVSLSDGGDTLDYVRNAFFFSVDSGKFFDNGRTVENLLDVCLVDHGWSGDGSVTAAPNNEFPGASAQSSSSATEQEPR